MKEQVKGKDLGDFLGRVVLELCQQGFGHPVHQVLQSPAPTPGGCCAVLAQSWSLPRVPGAAGEAVPVKFLWPGRGGEAEVPQDGAGEGALQAGVVNGHPILGQVEMASAADPGTTLESLEN